MLSRTISFYDESENQIGTDCIDISNLSDGQTKTFTAIVEVDYYVIEFKNGIQK